MPDIDTPWQRGHAGGHNSANLSTLPNLFSSSSSDSELQSQLQRLQKNRTAAVAKKIILSFL